MIQIKVCTAKLLKDKFGIEKELTEILFDEGLLQEHKCRDVLIKEEYNLRVSHSGKQMLKSIIADRYCVSIETVEKIIAKKL
jgi:hypothetical protein